jgi:hypothetical protein
MGFWVWGWGFGVWGPIPNPQSPIPNPQSPYYKYKKFIFIFNLKYIKIIFTLCKNIYFI